MDLDKYYYCRSKLNTYTGIETKPLRIALHELCVARGKSVRDACVNYEMVAHDLRGVEDFGVQCMLKRGDLLVASKSVEHICLSDS